MTTEDSEQTNPPCCQTVRAAEQFEGKQALPYAPGISAESVGAQNIHLQILTIPAGARGKAHKHEGTKPLSTSSAAQRVPGTAKASKNILLRKQGTLFTSRQVFPIFLITSARPNPVLP